MWKLSEIKRYAKYSYRQVLRYLITKVGGTLPLDESIEVKTEVHRKEGKFDVIDYAIVFKHVISEEEFERRLEESQNRCLPKITASKYNSWLYYKLNRKGEV